MKKFLFLLPMLALLLAGCDSDDPKPDPNEQIELKVESIQNPKALFAEYHSLDPGCGLPKMLRVEAGPDENEVVVKCTNFEINDILVNKLPWNIDNGKRTPEELGFSVSIVDAHTFKIHFNQYVVEKEEEDQAVSMRLMASRPLEGNTITQKETELWIVRYKVTPGWIANRDN